ncbi:MAG TPA: hypothetical protein VGC69_18875 [Bordetella sp.]
MQISFIPLRRAVLALGGALTVALAPAAASAQAPAPLLSSPADIESHYQAEVARCNAGQSGEDQDTCLREAAAARQQALQGGMGDQGGYSQNAIDRCRRLPASQQQDCMALMRSSTQTEGSVQSGGVLREMVIPVTPGSASPAPGYAPPPRYAPPAPPVSPAAPASPSVAPVPPSPAFPPPPGSAWATQPSTAMPAGPAGAPAADAPPPSTDSLLIPVPTAPPPPLPAPGTTTAAPIQQ